MVRRTSGASTVMVPTYGQKSGGTPQGEGATGVFRNINASYRGCTFGGHYESRESRRHYYNRRD